MLSLFRITRRGSALFAVAGLLLVARPALSFASTSRQDTAKAAPKSRTKRATRPASKSKSVKPVSTTKPNPTTVAEGATSAGARALDGKPTPVWPVKTAAPLPGSILPGKRADPSTPVQPALHLIAVVAQGDSGKDGKYRMRHSAALIERTYGWAKEKGALLFLDVQVGKSTIQDELPKLDEYLSRPDVHFGMDPEFSMKDGTKPGKKIGTYDASDVNWVIDHLAKLVTEKHLPPKVLVVHRFTQRMLTNADKIKLDPRVQVVIHMDGWGPQTLKRDSYAAYVYAEPVQFAGFKLFYRNDLRKPGSMMLTPAQILGLTPRPLYIQYQ
jgi:hypothetical protein